MNKQTQIVVTFAALVAVGVVTGLATWLVVRDDDKAAAPAPAGAEFSGLARSPGTPPGDDVAKLEEDKKANRGDKPREGDSATEVGAPNPQPPDECDPNGPPTVFAEWRFEPKSIGEARGKAKAVVFGEVTEVEAGPDIVISMPTEPGGEIRTPTTNATVVVERSFKGAAAKGSRLELTQVGNNCLRVEGDPRFQKGEKALLMLEDGPRGRLQMIAPEGRYRQGPDGTLNPVVDNEVTEKLKGKRPEEVGDALG